VELVAPLVNMTKAEIIRTGVALGVDYGLTHSCYDPAPDGAACGGATHVNSGGAASSKPASRIPHAT